MTEDALEQVQKGVADIGEKFGITFPRAQDGEAVAELVITERHRNLYGVPYGGYLFTLADNTAGAAFLSAGGYGVTVSGTTDFLRGAGPGTTKLICHAQVKKMGKTLCFVEAEVTDETGLVLTENHFIFANLCRKESKATGKEQKENKG